MQIRTAFVPELAGDVSSAVCIVIDMLRATTVIPVLFDRGCPRVYVADTHEKARRFARAKGYVLCGETEGFKVEDFDFGNSPTEFSRLDFQGKPVALSTTNGTKATSLVAGARKVYLGAAINRMAVALEAWHSAVETDSDIVLVCSGTRDQFTLEDATAAGLYVEAFAGFGCPDLIPAFADSSIACRRLWQSESNLLRGLMEGNHARTLADRGFGEDIGFCSKIDALSQIPTLVREQDADTTDCPVILIEN